METPAPRRVLICALRQLGDVVLTTPLIGMVHEAIPGCRIDLLVPGGMGDLVRPDPRVDSVIEHVRRGSPYMPRIALRYDWALSTNASDRSCIALLATGARRRFAASIENDRRGRWWKRLAVTRPTHRPERKPVVKWCLMLARAAGLSPERCEVRLHSHDHHREAARDHIAGRGAAGQPYFVIHPFSRHPYKEWPISKVAALSDGIVARHGLQPVWSCGPSARDRALVAAAAELAREKPVIADGCLPLPAVTALIREARLYVGVDTGITHMAAAVGTPTLALFGPTPVWYWGPWNNARPTDFDNPDKPGSYQNGHISVLQHARAFEADYAREPLDVETETESMRRLEVDEAIAETTHLIGPAAVHSAP